ncbi:hypothetical protein NUSPORA_02809 [Nucleospora cyclopteri]
MISFAFVTNEKAFLISQTTLSRSIIRLKESKEEVININNILLNVSGKQGDSYRLQLYIENEAKYLQKSLECEITQELITSLLKKHIYEKLRTRNPYEVDGMVLGMNSEKQLTLTHVDNYGATNETKYVTSNYGIYFLYGIFDSYYKNNMNEGECMNLINLCIKTLKEKLILDTNSWRVDVISNEGRHEYKYLSF